MSMTDNTEVAGHFWSVVLACGEGARMRAMIKATFGASNRKQPLSMQGNRSLFQSTLYRTRRISSRGEIIAVTVGDFEQISRTQIGRNRAELLVQAADQGTTSAIFLALSHIMARDPNACVGIFPSHHYVEPEDAFVRLVQRAVGLSALVPEKLILIGATPDRMESACSWLVPGATIACYGGSSLSNVLAFREKPSTKEARNIHQAGGLWSTFIIIGKAQTFFDIGATCTPGAASRLFRYQSAVDRCKESTDHTSLSETVLHSDFSNDVLQHVPDRLAAFHLTGLHWSDWGRYERASRSITQDHDVEPGRLQC